METNQPNGVEVEIGQPNIEIPNNPDSENSEQENEISGNTTDEIKHPTDYVREKADQICNCLCELLDPNYVLFFGKLAGKTPHSETNTFDLLFIVDNNCRYNWYDAKRYLKIMLPKVGHGAPYVNIYIHTQHDVESQFVPFFYLTRRQGIVLYRKCNKNFNRPRIAFDFGHWAVETKKYAIHFLPLADRLVEYAEKTIGWDNNRVPAFFLAQATVYYYRTLFFVYHGFDIDTEDIEMLHQRVRTLSGELMLLFEPDLMRPKSSLRTLKRYLEQGRYATDFFAETADLNGHCERIKLLGKAIYRICDKRIKFYENRAK